MQHQLHGAHRIGAEEQPAEADQVESHEDTGQSADRMHLVSRDFGAGDDREPELVQRQRYAVQRPPQHEADRRAVPQPAENHGDEQVEIGAQAPLAVAAQRDVEIVAEPHRERDVPPPPEFGDRGRVVGGVEVLREAEAQQQCQADGHVRITREVAVDLKGIAVDGCQTLHARIERRVVEDAVDEVERDIVRDDGLLEQTDGDEIDARAEHLARDGDRVLTDLHQKVAGADDRACDQLRKEREVEEVVAPAVDGFERTAVDVDRVAERLEQEERDADGQEDVLEFEESRAEEVAGDLDEEIGVLEVTQHGQIGRDAQRHERPLGASRAHVRDSPPDPEIADGDPDEQQQIDAARLVVEVEREGDDVPDAQRRRTPHEAVEEGERGEEKEEEPAAEKHRRLRIVAQQRQDAVDYLSEALHRFNGVRSVAGGGSLSSTGSGSAACCRWRRIAATRASSASTSA